MQKLSNLQARQYVEFSVAANFILVCFNRQRENFEKATIALEVIKKHSGLATIILIETDTPTNTQDQATDEAINEFLKLSNDYFLEYGNSLQNFIYWVAKNPITVKRDTESSNKLRIMTVHGSKGLQAPIVILCDTTKLPTMSDRFIWDENDQLLSAKSSSYIPAFYETIKAKEQHKKRLRAQREPLFAKLDIDYQRATETNADTSAIIAEKQRLRDITDIVHSANTLEELDIMTCDTRI